MYLYSLLGLSVKANISPVRGITIVVLLVAVASKEVKLERALQLKNKEIQKLKAQRDTTDEYAASMQKRSNQAVTDRDDSNFALKEALVEVEKYKKRLKIAESLIGIEKPKESNSNYLINPVSVGLASILAVVVFGRTFN